MKKKLIAILVLVLIASLALTAACKQEKDVKFICEDITVKVGETPDFNSVAKLTVDGTEIDGFQVQAQLQSGDPTKAGICSYMLSVVVGDKTYTTRATVTFTPNTADAKVAVLADNFSVRIGTEINWNERVTVTYDGTPIANPQLKVTKQSGNESKEGVCLYKVVYTRGGVDYAKTVQVRYTMGDALTDAEKQALNAAFAKTYSSYECVVLTERGDRTTSPDIYAFDLSKERIDGMTAHIEYSYEDNNYEIDQITGDRTPVHDEGSVQYYWQEDDTHFKHTFEYREGVWGYRYYGVEYAGQLNGYLPQSFQINEYGWDATDGYFEKIDETTFRARNNLDGYCGDIFGDEQKVSYTDMRLTLTGGYITRLQVKYTMQNAEYEDVEYTVTYEWSKFDNVSVTVPEAVDYELATNEHYVVGDLTDLTTDEQTNVSYALLKEYDAISSKMRCDTGDYTDIVCNFSNNGGLKAYITVKNYYPAEYDDKGNLIGDELVAYDGKFYFHDVDNVAWIYQMANAKDYSYYKLLDDNSQTTTTAQQISYNYIAVKSLNLTSDLFAKLGNKYVVKQDKLADAYAKLNQALDIDGSQANADKEDFTPQSYTLISCYFTLDGSGNVTKLAFILRDDTSRRYATYICDYADFNTAVVTLPTDRSLQELTADQQTAIAGALVNDVYDKVTVTESLGNVFIYDGDNATFKEVNDHGEVTDTVEFVREDGKWYQVKGDDRVELTGETLEKDFAFLCLNYDLAKLAQLPIKYDTLHKEYYAEATDAQVLEIAKYYSNFKELYDKGVTDEADKFGGFTGIGFGLNEDGSIAYVTVYAKETSVTATYSFESTQPAE